MSRNVGESTKYNAGHVNIQEMLFSFFPFFYICICYHNGTEIISTPPPIQSLLYWVIYLFINPFIPR